MDEISIEKLMEHKLKRGVIGEASHDSDIEPQFSVGDYVQHAASRYRMKITKFLGNRDVTGQLLYEAIDDNGEKHTISETILEPYSNEQHEIRQKTDKILSFLNISYSNDKIVQLENAMKIHKYIVQNSSYASEIMKEKEYYKNEEVYLKELYNGLINKRGVCSTDATVFKYLLSEIGMHGDVAILKSKEGGTHASTLVKLGDESYYFDTTLERTIFEQQSNNPEKFVFHCAALGQKEYGQSYRPIGIVPEEDPDGILPMPAYISQGSVPKIIIQSIGNQMQNLTFDEDTLYMELENIDAPIYKKDESTSIIAKKIHLSKDTIDKFMEEEK